STTTANLTGNLSASTPVIGSTANPSDSQVQTTVVVYDTLGRSHNIKFTFERQTQAANNNSWNVTAVGDSTMGPLTPNPATITFDDNGNLTSPAASAFLPASLGLSIQYNDIANPQSVNVEINSLTQLASPSEVNLASQDGYGAGNLLSFDISQ